MSDLPEYPWFDQVPADPPLRTKTQLGQAGLKPGGPVRARVVWRRRGKVHQVYDLYDEREAVPKRSLSEAQRAALERAQQAQRTCTVCGRVFEHRVAGRVCFSCAEAARLAELRAAARALLADPQAVMLDTETTGLDGWLVQIAVIDTAGTVLMDTLVNPQVPIPSAATAIHGITDAQVAGAPTFAQLAPQLREVLEGRTVVVYNVAFDRGILLDEIARLGRQEARSAEEMLKVRRSWRRGLRWACAMELYAEFVGDYSEYHESYRYQPLPGGDHTALGDARAALAVLRTIAGED